MTTVRIEIEGAERNRPARQRPGDAALDLRAAEAADLAPGDRAIIGTGVKIALPGGVVGIIKDRSGLAANRGLHVLAGVIDANYRGEIRVVIINLGRGAFRVEPGERIAQILFLACLEAVLVPVTGLAPTERGENGFGSTGTR